MQVSRNSNLKIPKHIEIAETEINSLEDKIAVRQGIAIANDEKIRKEFLKDEMDIEDKEWKEIEKIPSNANDLIAITVVKKLGAYVIAVTEKSPKKFRGLCYCSNGKIT